MTYKSLMVIRPLSLVLFVFIAGCQSANVTFQEDTFVKSQSLIHDHVFPAFNSYQIESPNSLFVLSEEAEAFVNAAIIRKDSDEKQVKRLMRAIFNRSDFDLLYQADANTNATTTFENRSANCLSLTIMAYAMTTYAGFDARFQEVEIPEFWTRNSGFSLLNGHINLRVVPRHKGRSYSLYRRHVIIDFDPQEGLYEFNANELSKERIVAMFYNNKAAELILKEKLNHAYAYLKAALQVDSRYKAAMLNLGLVYRKAGELEYAEQAYLAAIAVNDEYLSAWENLAVLYNKTNRETLASEIFFRLQRQRMKNPYYHLMLAEQALENDDVKQSIVHFKDAIKLDSAPHQFYFGLANAYLSLDDLDNTERYLRIAKRKAGEARISDEYGEKISILARLQNRKNEG